jgi:four helix bundle protein
LTSKELQERTKRFALQIIKLTASLPNKPEGWVIGKQIIRSGTSVASNYRAVCRAKSDKDFVSKMGTVIEEADETLFWLEMIEESEIIIEYASLISKLKTEANELTSIFVASNKTIKKRLNRQL